jgi:hypothetical protein
MQKISARFVIASVLLLCWPSISGLIAQELTTGTLSVDVADAANGPITDAFVLAYSDNGKKDGTAKLAQNGRFEISLEPGLYDVFVTSRAFTPMCKVVEIVRGHTTVLRSRLNADSEHLEQSSPKALAR